MHRHFDGRQGVASSNTLIEYGGSFILSALPSIFASPGRKPCSAPVNTNDLRAPGETQPFSSMLASCGRSGLKFRAMRTHFLPASSREA